MTGDEAVKALTERLHGTAIQVELRQPNTQGWEIRCSDLEREWFGVIWCEAHKLADVQFDAAELDCLAESMLKGPPPAGAKATAYTDGTVELSNRDDVVDFEVGETMWFCRCGALIHDWAFKCPLCNAARMDPPRTDRSIITRMDRANGVITLEANKPESSEMSEHGLLRDV